MSTRYSGLVNHNVLNEMSAKGRHPNTTTKGKIVMANNSKNINIIRGVYDAAKESVNILSMLSWSSDDRKEYAEFMVAAKDYQKLVRNTAEAIRDRDKIVYIFGTTTSFTSVDGVVNDINKLKEDYNKKTKEINDSKIRLGKLEPICIAAAINLNGMLSKPYEPKTEEETSVLNPVI